MQDRSERHILPGVQSVQREVLNAGKATVLNNATHITLTESQGT